ncbi:unnamed protein product [Ectocarpus sp. 12 AP-2014]
MPPVRLLALTVCGFLSSALRRPVRPQLHRCYYHQHQYPTSSSAVHGLHFKSMASTNARTITAGTTTCSIDSSGSVEESASLGLDTPAGVYRYLRGRWGLEKTIDYKAGGMAGTWRGVATFSPKQQQACDGSNTSKKGEEKHNCQDKMDHYSLLFLRYREQGTFRVNGEGAGFEAGQRLVYDCSGPVVRVHFVDDPKKPDALRFFHELDFQTARPYETTAGAKTGEEAGGTGVAAAAGASFAPPPPRAEFEHLCVRDMYRGKVEVVGPNEFKTSWHVTGPQKDGRINATFKRRLSEEDD